MGGVDLSANGMKKAQESVSPRPCGRGGFKHWIKAGRGWINRPRPCGRGGFKLLKRSQQNRICWSPPVWAGWI